MLKIEGTLNIHFVIPNNSKKSFRQQTHLSELSSLWKSTNIN